MVSGVDAQPAGFPSSLLVLVCLLWTVRAWAEAGPGFLSALAPVLSSAGSPL